MIGKMSCVNKLDIHNRIHFGGLFVLRQFIPVSDKWNIPHLRKGILLREENGLVDYQMPSVLLVSGLVSLLLYILHVLHEIPTR